MIKSGIIVVIRSRTTCDAIDQCPLSIHYYSQIINQPET